MENTKTAYLTPYGIYTTANGVPPQTKTEVKEDYLWWQKRNLIFTASGYGKRIPTTYKVKHNNRWKRVYCSIFSNIGVCFIEQNRKPVAIVDIY